MYFKNMLHVNSLMSLQIVGKPDANNTQQPKAPEPILESYATTDIVPAKDKKKKKEVGI